LREERGHLAGDQVVSEAVELWGNIAGDVTVVHGGKMYIRGTIYGNLIVTDGGRVHVLGNISGNLLVEPGAKVIHGGVVGGDVVNKGGRLYIEATARIMGRLKRASGKTLIDKGAKIEDPGN
jgi:cytoskeletal protein CcmA (bactofilin family)